MSDGALQAEELRIEISHGGGGQYRVAVSSAGGQFESSVAQELPASIVEDLCLLRWKAVRLRDPGDSLLIDVGLRLAKLVAPDGSLNYWARIVPLRKFRTTITFDSETEELLQLPWELLYANGRFLLQERGSHLVREVVHAVTISSDVSELRVLHVSIGIDPSLRLDEERRLVLNAVPESAPVTFLLNPSWSSHFSGHHGSNLY